MVDTGPEGGPRRQSRASGFATKSAAQEALNTVLSALQSGTFVAPEAVTFGEYLLLWMERKTPHLKASTADSYRRHVERVAASDIGAIKLQRLTDEHLTTFYKELLADGNQRSGGALSNRTVRYLHTVIAQALAAAAGRYHLINVSPATSAEPPAAKDSKSAERPA